VVREQPHENADRQDHAYGGERRERNDERQQTRHRAPFASEAIAASDARLVKEMQRASATWRHP
jgi:hypothetical protein